MDKISTTFLPSPSLFPWASYCTCSSTTNLSFLVVVSDDRDDERSHGPILVLHGRVTENGDEVLVASFLHQVSLAALDTEKERKRQKQRETGTEREKETEMKREMKSKIQIG